MVGLGPTDLLQNFLYIIERPVHGMLYFALLQALSKGLLIALDMEENTRRDGAVLSAAALPRTAGAC